MLRHRDAVLGEVGNGAGILEGTLIAHAGLAEMLGTAAQAFDMALEYPKTREQFGQVIGSFQASVPRGDVVHRTGACPFLRRSCAAGH